MGQALGRLIAGAGDLVASAGIAPAGDAARGAPAGYEVLVDIEEAERHFRDCEALIDFSAPDYLRRILDRHGEALAGRAVLVGTTGLDPDIEARLGRLAARAAVLVAPNFSVGVNVVVGLVERAARALPPDRYDVEIVETHHAGKADAPSGTALALGSAVAAGRDQSLDDRRRDGRSGRTGRRPPGEIGFHALRGGAVVGDHVVHFLGTDERILLGHAGLSRDVFAEGALLAARWLAGRAPGRYTMAHVLGLEDG
jgi:4-hydroxy-tetrahydrodipicolinate reductase